LRPNPLICFKKFHARLLFIFLLVFSNFGFSSVDTARCRLALLDATIKIPAEIGGKASDLKRYILSVATMRAELAAERLPEDAYLIRRADAWIESYTQFLQSRSVPGNEDPLIDGYMLLGYSRLGQGRLASSTGSSRFENLAALIKIPATKMGARPSDLRALIDATETDRDVVATRNLASDRILVRRVNRWLANAENLVRSSIDDRPNPGLFILGLSRLDEGAVLGGLEDEEEPLASLSANEGEPTPAIELFWESASEAFIAEIFEVLVSDRNLATQLKQSPAARLSQREQLIYLEDNVELQQFLRKFSARTLALRSEIDPFLIGAQVSDLKRYGENTKFLLEIFKSSSPRDPLIRLYETWLTTLENRVAQNASTPNLYLDGYFVTGLSKYGRLQPLVDPEVYRFRLPPLPLRPIEDFFTVESGSTVPVEAFNPKLDRLPVEYINLIAMILTDSTLGPTYLSFLPPNPTPGDQLEALMKDESIRRLTVDVAEAILTQASDRQKAIKGIKKADILFFGGGKVEQNMQNLLRQLEKKFVTMTLESKSFVGSTFRQGMYTFSLNSTSRPEDKTSLRQMLSNGPGMPGGDLNFFPGGKIQINQFDTRQNPVAFSAAAAITVNRSLAEADAGLQLETEAEGLYFIGDESNLLNEGGRFNWMAIDRNGGKTLARLAIYTGIGKPKIPENIKGLKKSYEFAQNNRVPGQPPLLMTLEDGFDWINESPNPYLPFSGTVTDVAGPGDSGKAMQRWLNLLADPRSYGRDTRSTPTILLSHWWGQECDNCDLFISSNRSYYADIGRAYRAKRIESRPKLGSVDIVDGKLVLTPAEISPGVLPPNVPARDEANFLFLTLGYESQLNKILIPTLGDTGLTGEQLVQSRKYFKVIEGFEPSLGKVPIARQLLLNGTPLPFFTVGPSSGPGIVTDPELAGVEENFVANVNNSWREWRLMEAIIKMLGESVIRPAERSGSGPNRLVRLELSSDANITPVALNFPTGTQPVRTQANNDILMAAEILNVLRAEFDLAGVKSLTLALSRMDEEKYFLKFETPVNPSQAELVAKRIAQYPRLARLLIGTIGPASRNSVAIIEYAFNSDGILDPGESGVSFRRR
jgi:hypothetical protein